MSTILDKFVRVSEDYPCPVCGKNDWCLVSKSGELAICQRVKSEDRWRDAGYLHIIENAEPPPYSPSIKCGAPTPDEIKALCTKWFDRMRYGPLSLSASQSLGVSQRALKAMGVGDRGDCWSFPMVDDRNNVIGVRFRNSAGKKWSLAGGRNGLFIPGRDGSPALIITEGPTDAMAAWDMGYRSIGRPDCNGGEDHIVDWLRSRRENRVVIVADRDEPGKKGARKLAKRLAHGPSQNSIVNLSVLTHVFHEDLWAYYNGEVAYGSFHDAVGGHPDSTYWTEQIYLKA